MSRYDTSYEAYKNSGADFVMSYDDYVAGANRRPAGGGKYTDEPETRTSSGTGPPPVRKSSSGSSSGSSSSDGTTYKMRGPQGEQVTVSGNDLGRYKRMGYEVWSMSGTVPDRPSDIDPSTWSEIVRKASEGIPLTDPENERHYEEWFRLGQSGGGLPGWLIGAIGVFLIMLIWR